MIEATFYKYNGKYNALPKTLGTGTTLQGLLRDAYNVNNPIITVRQTVPFEFNYCYVPVFGKYYFIDKVDVTGNDTARLTLSCDVLQTYADAILQSTGTVTQKDNPNRFVSNRTSVYDMRPKWDKIPFPNTNLLTDDGSIIMVTIKGKDNGN